jgi:hypothetical protein
MFNETGGSKSRSRESYANPFANRPLLLAVSFFTSDEELTDQAVRPEVSMERTGKAGFARLISCVGEGGIRSSRKQLPKRKLQVTITIWPILYAEHILTSLEKSEARNENSRPDRYR